MNLFSPSDKNKQFWIRALFISLLVFITLFILQKNLNTIISSEAIKRPLLCIEKSWANMSFMVFLVSGFILLFNTKNFGKILNVLSPLGKMSLSNYVFQSLLGSSIYYGFGMGMYRYTGASYGLFIGLFLALLLGIFCTCWNKSHTHGPLETIWHKASWIRFR